MVAHTCNPRAWEDEAGGQLASGQANLYPTVLVQQGGGQGREETSKQILWLPSDT